MTVVLALVAEDAKVLFDFLIHAFSFTIALRVVSGSETCFNVEVLIQGSHEMCSKLQATITVDLLWNAVESEYVFVVKVSDTFSGDHVIGKREMSLTSQMVNVSAD